MNTREKRFLRGKVEIRDITPEQRAAGYIGAIDGFIPYNSDSREMRDGKGRPFIERLAPALFTRSLAEGAQNVFADVGHDDSATFARRGVNLEIIETDAGIKWTALLPDTSVGRDLQTNVRLGIIDGTSFEFEIRTNGAQRGEVFEKRDALTIRTITDAILHRVNPVTEPAYTETTLAARSCQEFTDAAEAEAKHAPEPFTQTGARAARFGLR